MKSTAITQLKRTSVTQSTFLLVLSAETALFGTLVMSYLFMRNGGSDLPFIHPKPFDFAIAGLNTIIFLASAAFAWNAHRAIQQGPCWVAEDLFDGDLASGCDLFCRADF